MFKIYRSIFQFRILFLFVIFVLGTGILSCKKEPEKKLHATYVQNPGKIEPNQNTAIRTSDGNLLFCGRADNSMILLLKTTPEGEEIWRQTYEPFSLTGAFGVAENTAGDLFICGNDLDFFRLRVLKTNSKGEEQWLKTFEDSSAQLFYGCATALRDGNMLICAAIYNASITGVAAIKLNSDGDTIWSRTHILAEQGQLSHVLETKNNDLLITGIESGGFGNDKSFFLRLFPDGTKRGFMPFKEIMGTFRYTLETENEDLISCGGTGGFSFTSQGLLAVFNMSDPITVAHSNIFGFGYENLSESFHHMSRTDDGNLLFTGTGVENTAGTSDILIVKADIKGKQLWYRSFGGTNSFEFATASFQTAGTHIIAGSRSENTPSGSKDNIFVTRINSTGDFL